VSYISGKQKYKSSHLESPYEKSLQIDFFDTKKNKSVGIHKGHFFVFLDKFLQLNIYFINSYIIF